ncbi:hypothetical protein ACOBR2_09345 [Telmatobacter bradus]|uniref:hypothetical protein n=1 Tax=Telmatobacter bradus TaxID=474953 RepID=UPI003B43456A
MPKPISWSNRMHEIRDRVRRSKVQTWNRRDLENLFLVKRASAQSLMKAIGGIQNIGGTHLVDRVVLLQFLERAIGAEDLSLSVQQSKLNSGPVPKPRRLTFSLPAEMRSIMVDDLPETIRLEPGRLTIEGEDAEAIIESLYMLAQAMQNDLYTVQVMLDPVPHPPAVEDDELQRLFGRGR